METLGQFLKREREFRKITLEDLAKRTKIVVSVLKNLESDQMDKLSKGIYLKGYLRSYATALGLSVEDIQTRYLNLPQEYQKKEDPLVRDDVLMLKNGINM